MGNRAVTVGVISNPTSGHNRSHFAAVANRLAQTPAIQHIVTSHAGEIDDALIQLANADVRVLAINGGDGTTSAILGRLLETDYFSTLPRIALLPGGTANMNAGDVGVRGSLRRAVARFCGWVEQPTAEVESLSRHLLRIEREGVPPVHSMFVGGGAIIHGTEYAHREIHSRGLRDDFSLILGTLRTVWGVLRDDPRFNRHVSIQLQLDDGISRQFDTLILAVSTLGRLSFGMRPFWAKGPGAIRVTVMEQGCSRFGRTFLSIIRGKPSANATAAEGYHSFNSDRVSLVLTGSLNLDGEIIDCDGEVRLSATRALEFIRP